MKAIGFSFNNFDFIIHPFQFSIMDGIVTMIKDAIAISFKHVSKTV